MKIFIDNFHINKEDDDILMSDSIKFKNNEKIVTYMYDFVVGHIGIHIDDPKIKNTQCEFFIITRSRKILK